MYLFIYSHKCGKDDKETSFADIDPCLENNGGCSHNCSLVKGKRVCSCPAGEKLIYDLRTCKGL